jgi:hypothetical protein
MALGPVSELLGRWAPVAGDVHGDRVEAAMVRTLDVHGAITARDESPLAEAVARELGQSADSRLFLVGRRAAQAVRQWLAGRGLWPDIVHPADTSGLSPVELACAVGATRWHPDHLVTAPRARSTAFIHHEWIREPDSVAGLFGAPGGVSVRVRWIGPPPAGPDAGELETQPEWGAIAGHGREAGDQAEELEAFVVVVSGGKRVLLDADAMSSILVVEPGAPRGSRVRRERVPQLLPGDFILLRTDRGRDDVIRVIANRLLGPASTPLRQAQAHWKELLSGRVDERGYGRVLRDLVQLGVSARNLRGWLSPDSIRPERREDFALILRYCGLGEEEAAPVWRQMERLDRAHLKAGQEVRRLLEDQIEDADLAALRSSGFMAVRLGIPGTGSLGVFRIEAIAPDTLLVPASEIRVVQDLPEDLWHG